MTGAQKILVTGATGFLGTELVSRLRASGGSSLRLLATTLDEGPEAEGEPERIRGSVLDPSVLARAVEGVDGIYHLAGRVSRDPDQARELYRIHVEGTTELCRAAKKAGVKRIVLASTSGTIAVTATGETIPDEGFAPPIALIGGWPYYTSKLYQEEAARRVCEGEGGPELVILNPSLLLGPGDRRLSSTEDVLKFLAGDIPVTPPGGVNFVDVRDVAQAFAAAMERGRPDEHYLLGGPNWTFEKFFARLERVSKVKAPRIRLPDGIYKIAGQAMDAFYRQWELVPPVDRISAEMGRRFWYCDSSKAERELGFVARDPFETLHETVAYLNREFLGEGVMA